MKTYDVIMKETKIAIEADNVSIDGGMLRFEKCDSLVACFAHGHWVYFEEQVRQSEFALPE